MHYFDPTYLVYMIPALIISLIAQSMVKSRFNKFSRVLSSRRLTGADVASYILRANNISNVSVERTSGNLTDNFNPKTNTINLSDDVYGSSSIAAIGVAAHEAGHAVQHAQEYAPIKVRMAMVPVTNFASTISVPLIFMGYLFSYSPWANVLVWAGIGLFSVAVLFQLITLPVEFNASSRALEAIESFNLLDEEEIKGARKVLSAAALTYVAAMLQSLLTLLYYVSRFSNRRR